MFWRWRCRVVIRKVVSRVPVKTMMVIMVMVLVLVFMAAAMPAILHRIITILWTSLAHENLFIRTCTFTRISHRLK